MPEQNAEKTVPVSMRALIQRINRKLKPENETLKVLRGDRWRNDLGNYFIVDFYRNVVVAQHVEPEKLGRELEVLKPWEHIVE